MEIIKQEWVFTDEIPRLINRHRNGLWSYAKPMPQRLSNSSVWIHCLNRNNGSEWQFTAQVYDTRHADNIVEKLNRGKRVWAVWHTAPLPDVPEQELESIDGGYDNTCHAGEDYTEVSREYPIQNPEEFWLGLDLDDIESDFGFMRWEAEVSQRLIEESF